MFLKSLFLSQCLSFKWEGRDISASRSIEKLLKELSVSYLKNTGEQISIDMGSRVAKTRELRDLYGSYWVFSKRSVCLK